MKKIYFATVTLIIFAAIIGITSCSTKDPIIIKYDLGILKATLPTYAGQHYHTFTFPVKQTDIKAAFSAAGQTWNPDKIKKASLKGIDVEVDLVGQTFDDLASIELYAKDDSTTADGLQIAYTDAIPTGGIKITLKLNGSDMLSLVKKDHFNLFLKVLTKGAITEQTIKLTSGAMQFEVQN
jgi:hypothetical protein